MEKKLASAHCFLQNNEMHHLANDPYSLVYVNNFEAPRHNVYFG